MRFLLLCAALVLTLGVGRADLAPPPFGAGTVPATLDDAVSLRERSTTDLVAIAEAGREDLKAVMDSVKAAPVDPKGRSVTPHAQLPPNPCKSDMTAALRLCAQWLRNSMLRAEAATLDLMRARLTEAKQTSFVLGNAMREAIAEQKAYARGEPPPARPIPRDPCRGWNVSFWKSCIARIDATLAGNLPDGESAAEIIRARDQLIAMLDAMVTAKKMDERRIRIALAGQTRLTQAVVNAIARAGQAQRALSHAAKTFKRGA